MMMTTGISGHIGKNKKIVGCPDTYKSIRKISIEPMRANGMKASKPEITFATLHACVFVMDNDGTG